MEPRRSAVAQVVDNLPMHFFKDLSLSAFTAGFVAVLVGFTSSVAIVFQAALALGATPNMVASWMWALGIGMGLCTLLPSLWLKKPVMVAWSTPGAAVLATAATACRPRPVAGRERAPRWLPDRSQLARRLRPHRIRRAEIGRAHV